MGLSRLENPVKFCKKIAGIFSKMSLLLIVIKYSKSFHLFCLFICVLCAIPVFLILQWLKPFRVIRYVIMKFNLDKRRKNPVAHWSVRFNPVKTHFLPVWLHKSANTPWLFKTHSLRWEGGLNSGNSPAIFFSWRRVVRSRTNAKKYHHVHQMKQTPI